MLFFSANISLNSFCVFDHAQKFIMSVWHFCTLYTL